MKKILWIMTIMSLLLLNTNNISSANFFGLNDAPKKCILVDLKTGEKVSDIDSSWCFNDDYVDSFDLYEYDETNLEDLYEY